MSLRAPVVILNEPQLAENIGAVARVMANFGLSELRLVRPRDGWPQERAWASASGANWPLDGARVFETLAEAIGDLSLVFATTARPRETQLPVITPRQAAADLHARVAAGQAVGMLFGGERAGLETHDIALCQAIVTIPVDERFRSLNLAQAVALNAYEWRLTIDEGPRQAFAHNALPPADQKAMMGLYEQLEHELDEAGQGQGSQRDRHEDPHETAQGHGSASLARLCQEHDAQAEEGHPHAHEGDLPADGDGEEGDADTEKAGARAFQVLVLVGIHGPRYVKDA